MPFVPTPILALYDIGHFEEEDAWDALTDTNWARVERAAHGVGTVTVGSLDVTIDDTPYTGTDGIPTALVLQGSQANDLFVTLPPKQRVYSIINATTAIGGPWKVTLRNADETPGVEMLAGERALITSDGTTTRVVFHSGQAYGRGGGAVSGDITLGGLYRVRSAADAALAQDYVTLAQLNAAITAIVLETITDIADYWLTRLASAPPALAQTLGAVTTAAEARTAIGSIFNSSYVSAATAMSDSPDLITLAHGMAVAPTLVALSMTCTSSDAGYSAGEVVLLNPAGDSSEVSHSLGVYADATNIRIRQPGGGWTVTHKSTGTYTNITETKWLLTVRAWA